jgi:tRNA G18 (ribose-2'-O)-methylase SpoU
MKDRKLLNIELGRITADEYRTVRPSSGTVLVLDNIRSAHNVGSAFRTADAFGVDKIYLGGICPVPPSPELHKVALGAEEVVPFEHVSDVVDLVRRLQGEGYTVIAVEQTVNSVKLDEFQKAGGDTDFSEHRPFFCEEKSVSPPTETKSRKFALVFGNEVAGVQQEVVDACDFALEIPQKGTKHSLNVSVSIGVVLWGLRP